MRRMLNLILLAALVTGAQWMRTYEGGPVKASAIRVTDGGYIAAGTSYDGEDSDGYIMKVNSSGDIIWNRTYGLPNNDGFVDMEYADDGGFYIFGGTQSYGAMGTSFWLLRVDSEGDTLWSHVYGDRSEYMPAAMAIDPSGNIIMAGSKAVFHVSDGVWAYNYWVIKVDSNGELIWQNSFGDSRELIANSVTANRDMIIVAGQRLSDMRMHACAISTGGLEMWQRTYPGTSANDIISVSSGGFLLSGHGTDFTLTPSAILTRIDEHGDTLWVRGHGGSNNIDEPHAVANAAVELADGGFAVCGIYNEMYDWEYHNDILVMKVNSVGELHWLRHHGDLSNQIASDIETDGDCLLMSGLDESIAVLVRTDRSGLVAPSDDTENKYLAGYILDNAGEYPIASATVELYASILDIYPAFTDITDSYGSFFFDPGEGSYIMHVPERATYDNWYYPGTTHPLESNPIVLDSTSAPVTWFNVLLPQSTVTGVYAVSGRVTTVDLESMNRCHVIAISSDEVEEDETVIPTRADSTGRYSLDLPPGDWYIFACADGFIPYFYGDNYMWEFIDVVTVSTAAIFDIDIALPYEDTLTGTNTVEFFVTRLDSGYPLVNGCRVYLTDFHGNPLRSGITDETGHAVIEDVASGSYGVVADKVGFRMEAGWDSFTVATDTVIAVNIEITRELEGISEPVERVIASETPFLNLYPNPAFNTVEIEFDIAGGSTIFSLHDITGREVISRQLGMLSPGRHTLELDLSNLPGGVYCARTVCNGAASERRKLFLRN